MTITYTLTKEDLYRRLRDLPDSKIPQVIAFIDSLEEYEPNEETIAAMEEAERIARDPEAKRYADLKELFSELRAE